MANDTVPAARRAAEDELAAALLGRNTFAIVLVGAVGFIAACGWVFFG